MRKIVFMIAAILIAAKLMAADTADFKIEAYRIDPTRYLKIDIIDAIGESLRTNPDSIDITNYLELFMGRVMNSEEPDPSGSNSDEIGNSMFSEHVVFAYRVAGTAVGTYRIKIDLEPFYKDGNQSSEEGKYIAAAFEIGNESYTYTKSGGSTYTASGETYSIGETVPDNQRDSRIILDNVGDIGQFVKEWNVSAGSTQEWVARGSVSLDVGPMTYSSAEYGQYSSTVTVNLESV